MLRFFAYLAAVGAVLLLSMGYLIVTDDLNPLPSPSGEASPPAEPSPGGSQEPTPSSTPVATPGEVVGTMTIHAHEAPSFGFEPVEVTVPTAGWYEVTFINDGTLHHDVTFDDGTNIPADGGVTVTGTVYVPAEGIGFICSVSGHADSGMVGTVTVSGG